MLSMSVMPVNLNLMALTLISALAVPVADCSQPVAVTVTVVLNRTLPSLSTLAFEGMLVGIHCPSKKFPPAGLRKMAGSPLLKVA